MKKQTDPTILFVDDDPSMLKALERLFRKQAYTIYTAPGGQDALNRLGKEIKQVSVIVSDQKMPEMDGPLFLERTKKIFPDAIRILLTGNPEISSIVAAVNKGEIHRYLTKPWNDAELVMQVQKAVEQFDLIQENKLLMAKIQRQNKQLFDFGRNMGKKMDTRSKELEEKNKALEFLNKELEMGFFNTIRAFAALLETVNPIMRGHGKRVAALAAEIARRHDLDEAAVSQIEIAAILHDIGSIGFSGVLIKKYCGGTCSTEELEQYQKHPVEGQNILSFISRLDEVGVLVRHHHERYDGKGYPDALFETEIPLGSRILAVADIYDRVTVLSGKKRAVYMEKYLAGRNIPDENLTKEELLQQAALFHIKQFTFSKYDPTVVKILLDILKEKGVNQAREKKLTFKELKPGMCLTRSVYSSKGHFILPHKTELDPGSLGRLKTILDNKELADVFFVMSK